MRPGGAAVWLTLAPALAALAALALGGVWLKVAVAATGALAVAAAGAAAGTGRQRPLAVGLAGAAVGDYLLALGPADGLFLAGIGTFAAAHAGYLWWSVRNGGVRWGLFAFTAVPLMVWFVGGLAPHVGSTALAAAVLAYALLSLLTLSSAPALALGPAVRLWFTAGVALLVASDVLIALSRFQGLAGADALVLPLYFAAQVAVTAAALLAMREPVRGGSPDALAYH